MDIHVCNILALGILFLISVNVVDTREVIQRYKRDTHCEPKFRDITQGHTACLNPSPKMRAGGLEEGDIKTIVDLHNKVRREVSPAASNMLIMSWDDEIANIAKKWAENCVIDHDSNYKRYDFGRYNLGQNLAWSTGNMDWSKAIQLWADEKKDYDYNSNSSPTGQVIGHYTQMVWATSHKIGCGYALCDSNHYYVCNYGPGGNSGGAKPYVAGGSCSACSANCNDGLCDCGDKTCFNGGTLNLQSCTCSCVKSLSFFLPSNCGLNCTAIEEPRYCTQQYGQSGCMKYTNVPQECPDMCGWCPAAEYKYREPTGAGARATISYLQIMVATLLLCVLF